MEILFAEITGWAWLKLAAIPFIAGLVGYVTNVLALRMTFYPLEFVGYKKLGLGWQGIIPSKATKMAEKSVDMMTTKLVKVEEVFSRMEPMRVADEMGPAMQRLTHDIIEETMQEEAPVLWDNAPALLKRRIFQRAGEDLPEIIEHLMREVKHDITDLFDLKGMVVSALEQDKPLLNHIFLKVGEEEFRFIERSGFYFGFLFGIVQTIVFYFVQGLVDFATFWLIGGLGNKLAGAQAHFRATGTKKMALFHGAGHVHQTPAGSSKRIRQDHCRAHSHQPKYL